MPLWLLRQYPRRAAQAVKENEGRPPRAVIIAATRSMTTRTVLTKRRSAPTNWSGRDAVFLSSWATTLHRAQASVLGQGLGRRISFDPRTQQQHWRCGSGVGLGRRRRAGCEDGRASGDLLLQHLKQGPMPIIEECARVRLDSDIKK